MQFTRGRPRTRPPVRKVTVEIDEELFAAVAVALGGNPLRVVVEIALREWLARHASAGQAAAGQRHPFLPGPITPLRSRGSLSAANALNARQFAQAQAVREGGLQLPPGATDAPRGR